MSCLVNSSWLLCSLTLSPRLRLEAFSHAAAAALALFTVHCCLLLVVCAGGVIRIVVLEAAVRSFVLAFQLGLDVACASAAVLICTCVLFTAFGAWLWYLSPAAFGML